MIHDEILERLDDWADDRLPPAERAALEAHLGECAGCGAEAEALRWLKEEAGSLPRAIAPRRDLWPEIEARIAARRVIAFPTPAEAAPRTAATRWPRASLLAAAAVALMLVSSAVTALVLRGGGEPGTIAVQTPAPAPAYTALAAFEPAEAEYRSAIDELSLLLEAGREVLDPATLAVVEENLAIIDRAIADSRAALEADPNNRELTYLLSSVYRRKVDLLKSATLLQTRI